MDLQNEQNRTARNGLIGPGTETIDLGANKYLLSYLPSFERTRLQFRAESFNLMNHTYLSAPAANVSATTFGKISSQSNNPRVLRFALRLEF